MKISKDLDNPVRASWFADQSYRLDASPYLSGAYEARKLLERLSVPKVPLHALTVGHNGGIYNGPKFRRVYVNDREYGVPFLGSTDIMEADFSNLPLLRKEDALSPKLAYLRVRPGMTLISCSGTVGRMCYVRSDMADFWSSQDVLKVVADECRVAPGYLYAFLYSNYGIPMITAQASGSMIRHLEPEHIADLPVPRFGHDVERRIHELIQEAADLRAKFQAGVDLATRDLFESACLSDLVDIRWHAQSRDLGFVASATTTSLRALNFSPRAGRIIDAISAVPHRLLGEICKEGQLSRGSRFKRIDSDSSHGVKLIGQRQGFWLRPEGRWIALKWSDLLDIKADDETVMIASRGTLGENEVYCRSFLVTGKWQREYAFSEDLLRVVSGDKRFPGAYLFAFLRSEAAFRLLRSMSTGGKQQDIHEELRKRIPIPECTPEDRERIAETVRQAYRWRDEADMKEDQALTLLDEAVREAAG
ncbi:type I restriction-modification system restriction endonuclease DNA specificity subunit HsdS [Microbispora rosea subsp. aerata]|nr:restriction endonuclease subunit S [Microbispora rosea]GGO04486.1 type I restriction-modification system restriction endonuclease DNA specificity subunit HsdS [Microbispora rosea subsp. aerata]GIH56338.1 type I restriction-modification system restriction endonuclease DNA specificity subunit HsdS [Microbispora rosea subsp. aerata]GLJ82221.1 type I restriction-modification system restriction endonuclease DNA specificity subunit HsdS [Microbispora rosea subsp. aerata]